MDQSRNIDLFNSLFKGRTDVFAIRWEKPARSAAGKNKCGYVPAYQFDPYRYRQHKITGGTFKNYKDKTYLPLTDYQLEKHFNGDQLIGIYPLLQDNTSWFIAADFDEENWINECKKLIIACEERNIPVYLERSRSGKGGHVWIFFDKPYPAIRSRKILISLLEQAGVFSVFDKSSSFDRLFPNQDFHSGKGIGNLIALPFHKPSLELGNSCFINENLEPYEDQWKFLSTIKRVSTSNLDLIYNSLKVHNTSSISNPDFRNVELGKLHVRLDYVVHLNRSGMTTELINFLKESLNFTNSEYYAKKNTGKNTWGTERYFRFIEESEHEVSIPRGFIGKLLRYCRQQNINYEFRDNRKKHSPILFEPNFKLRSHQEPVIEAASRKEFGVITAPPGSGKTVIALKIIAEKQQPALIIVHRKQLLEQWIERTVAFLGLPKQEIGRIGQGKVKPGKAITVAMIQSLGKYLHKQETEEFAQSFGTIIVDECHHIPAETFRSTITKLSPYYQYGLTATPFRKGNDDKLIFTHLGEIIADIKPKEIEEYKRARIIVRETSLDVPFNSKTDLFETLSKVLIHDSTRNKLILTDITAELKSGRRAVIITERKDHINALYHFLKGSFEILTLSGEDSENNRKAKFQLLNTGNYQALITTGQFFGEGIDLPNASCLFLVYPFSFKGKLVQYIGRVQRSEIAPIIYDYRDRKIEYLDRLFLKRNSYYRNFDRQASLFDDPEITDSKSKGTITLDKQISIPIERLDFRYGAVAFEYYVTEMSMHLEFEIDHDGIRPEFDVLKPYFAKVLKLKKVRVEVFAEFEQNMLVSQRANSTDIEKINQEVIESVRFRFVEQNIIRKQSIPGKLDNILDLEDLQKGQKDDLIYDSEEELLQDLLKNEKVKHYKQLRYLASKHVSTIMKLKFVLNPFSFVFLLKGIEQYHLILETLDTEEATYIWHLDDDLHKLPQNIRLVEKDLSFIRNRGRQAFIEMSPENFSRLIHDYGEERKGFIVWKDQLEERLV